MPTISDEQRKNFLKQLKDIQDNLQGLSQRNQPTNSAQNIGARGFGAEQVDAETSGQINQAIESGVPLAALGDTNESGKTNLEQPQRFSPTQVSKRQSEQFVKSFGLEGIVDASAVVGLSPQEANTRLLEERQKRSAQSGALTSGVFNSEVINRTQRAVDKFNFSLDELTNDPFDAKDVKTDKQNSAIEVASKELGSLFSSQEELINAFQTNPQLRQTLDGFLAKGGTLEKIARNVSTPVINENVQGIDQFLANIQNPNANAQAQQEAFEELAPEREITQKQIAREAQIPEQLENLYFGNEKQIGLLEVQQQQALEEIRIVEEREKDASRVAQDRARLQIDKKDAEVAAAKAKTEKNRLAAKNFMTARLAKLGALKTTGAAPVALRRLEIEYQDQINQLDTNLKFFNEAVEIDLDNDLSNIENKTDEIILGIQEDLTLDRDKIAKELLKARRAADKEINRLTEQYARRFRQRTTKYETDLKKAAEKYAKDFARKAAGGLDVDAVGRTVSGPDLDEGEFVPNRGVVLPDGSFSKLKLTAAQTRDVGNANIRGVDTIKFFVTLPKSFKDSVIRDSVGSTQGLGLNRLRKMFDAWNQNKGRSSGSSTQTAQEDDLDLFQPVFGNN